MKLVEFLQFNSHCPICGRELNLYMQWIDAPCFHAFDKKINESGKIDYYFQQFKCKNQDIGTDDCQDDLMILTSHENNIETEFTSYKLLNEAKKYQIYFFFLCNPAGFQDRFHNDYEINLSKGCYYRSTPMMELQQLEDKSWKLSTILPESQNIINKDEAFALIIQTNVCQKIYMLNIDEENQKSSLWYYIIPNLEKENKKFKPKLFNENFPHIRRPDLAPSNRERLISKLDSWILLS
jgi:hypothetical protein